MGCMNTRDIEARSCVIEGLAFDKGASSIDSAWRYRRKLGLIYICMKIPRDIRTSDG